MSAESLSRNEIERYTRHIVIPQIGGAGQAQLKRAHILMIGAGALAAPALQYLTAAGIGAITIMDDDVVSLSNLQRQIIYNGDDLGQPKAERAATHLARLNPHVKFHVVKQRLTAINARESIAGHNIVLDGCDNFSSRLILSDACFFEKLPLISGAIGRFDGTLTCLRPFERDQKGIFYPTFRCINPDAPSNGDANICRDMGVVGPLAGVVGALMAIEAMKELLKLGTGLAGQLLLIDLLSLRFTKIACRHSANNPLNGDAPQSFEKLHGLKNPV